MTYRFELNSLIVVPPMGTARPGPCTSHIVKAICEVRSSEGYVMGKRMLWDHLLISAMLGFCSGRTYV
jgi:hypothetical protein